jgi:K+-transporting ATPase c subunit
MEPDHIRAVLFPGVVDMHNYALQHSEAEAERTTLPASALDPIASGLDSDVCWEEARIDYETVSAFALQFCFADFR